MEFTNPKNYKAEQILKAEAIYSVFFKGAPINLRSLNTLVNYPGPKYKKVSFSNPGHAHNLAQKLNAMFKCSDFEVYQLDSGKLLKDETY